MPSNIRNTRGLRVPTAGCKLMKLRVALTYSGRSRLSRKQATVTGRGRALTSATVSMIERGRADTPGGGGHRRGAAGGVGGASLPLPPPPQPRARIASVDSVVRARRGARAGPVLPNMNWLW
jgi:hypothetical protein